MCEWLKQAVLKTAVPERVPGVRIPLPPPCSLDRRESLPSFPAKFVNYASFLRFSLNNRTAENGLSWLTGCTNWAFSLQPPQAVRLRRLAIANVRRSQIESFMNADLTRADDFTVANRRQALKGSDQLS